MIHSSRSWRTRPPPPALRWNLWETGLCSRSWLVRSAASAFCTVVRGLVNSLARLENARRQGSKEFAPETFDCGPFYASRPLLVSSATYITIRGAIARDTFCPGADEVSQCRWFGGSIVSSRQRSDPLEEADGIIGDSRIDVPSYTSRSLYSVRIFCASPRTGIIKISGLKSAERCSSSACRCQKN